MLNWPLHKNSAGLAGKVHMRAETSEVYILLSEYIHKNAQPRPQTHMCTLLPVQVCVHDMAKVTAFFDQSLTVEVNLGEIF